jgi:type 1 glutamine amidotransferase
MSKNEKPTGQKPNMSRRGLMGLGAAIAAAATAPFAAKGQPAPAAPPAGAPPAGGGGRGGRGGGAPRLTPGGSGPIKVLFITKYHPFDRENLFLAFDKMGDDITWTSVEHPAAEAFFDPKLAAQFDVLMFYDAYTGRVQKPGATPDARPVTTYDPPSPELVANFKKLLQNGDKGFVFLHHACAAWVHSWPAGVNGSNAYVEVVGAAADWGTPIKNIRGVDYPASGAKGGNPQHITIVDKTHPVTAGVEDFDITDESYLCPMFEDSVHPLMRSNFMPTAAAFANRGPAIASHPPGSNLTGWVKTAERSPVVYIQHGHDNTAWTNPAWSKLVLNAIKWAASPESKAWAHANPKKIFV